jgi:hypothetical protein
MPRKVRKTAYLNPERTSTATTMAMDLHHAKADTNGRWDRERFLRLAGILGLTVNEMASMLLIKHSAMKRLLDNNLAIHKGGNRSLYLLLSIIEQTYAGKFIDDPIELIPPQVKARHG